MLWREGRHAACDPYGQRPTTAGRQCGAENLVADTPKALTHELQLISTSRFAHLCRSRPRSSIREQGATTPKNLRPTRPPLQFGCFEAPLVFHHFPFCCAHRSARGAHRLELETKTLASRRPLFFPSRRAGCAVVSPVR